MDNFLGWLRDIFKNDDIVSAITGETVEPPISDPKRKRNTQISTAGGYVTLFAVIVFLSTILPEPPQLEIRGERVEPPISDPKRKRNTQISTAVGYVTLFAVIVFLSTILPEPPKLARNPDLPNLIFVMTEGPGGGGG